MSDIHFEKAALREAIKQRLARLSPEDRVRESRSLCKRLVATLPKTPGTICVFYPMPTSEADIRALFPVLQERGWTMFFPRFEDGTSFSFRRATETDLVPGRYGLSEPPNNAPTLNVRDVTLALIPGLAFDASGNRIGRGNGGYDRWLQILHAKNPAANTWGIALDCQMVTHIPREPHDETVNLVITPRGIIDPSSPETGPR